MSKQADSALQRELFVVGLLGVAALFLLFIVVGFYAGDFMVAGVGLLQSVPLWGGLWVLAWLQRSNNRAAVDSALWTTLGIANRLTLLRGVLIAATAGFLLQPSSVGLLAVIPATCYSLAAVLDRVDGHIARKRNQQSLFGASLDINYDAVGLVVAPLLAVQYGKLPLSYLCVSAAYYLFVIGLWWRRSHRLPIAPLRPSTLRRTLAGMQMGYIAAVLWPPIQDILARITAIAFMLPLLIGFWIDWLTVSTRLPTTVATENAFARLAAVSSALLLPLMRLLLVLALWVSTQPIQSQLTPPQFTLLILVAGGIAFGIAGRSCALLLLLTLNFITEFDFISSFALVVQCFSVWLLLFGTGRYSAWQADSEWIQRQENPTQDERA